MTVSSAVSELRSQGVNVSLSGLDICCVAPKGCMTSEQILFLKTNKEKIIRYLELEDAYNSFWEASLENNGDPIAKYPLTSTQSRLWLIDKMDATVAYNMPAALSFSGNLDVERLILSLKYMVKRHPIFRACIDESENGCLQAMIKELDIAIPLNRVAVEDVPAYIQSFACRRFDLNTAPLVRFEIIKSLPQKYFLLMNLHHIIGDGLSLEVFIKELSALYSAGGREHGLGPDGDIFPFSGYAIWQHDALNRNLFENQLAFWKQRLAGIPVLLPLPTDLPRPKVKTWAGCTKTFILSPDTVQSASRLGAARQTTMFTILLAVFYILLKKYGGQDDIPVGIPVVNRPDNRLADTIGCFVNTVISRVHLSSNMPFTILLKQVGLRVQEAFAHQEVPFEKVVEILEPERIPGVDPLFQVMFSHQTIDTEKINFSGVQTEVIDCQTLTSKFDLSMSFESRGESIRGRLEYRTDLFASRTVADWIKHYRRILAQVLDHPDIRIGDISILTSKEHLKYARSWKTTFTPLPEDCWIPGLFEKQVQRTPNAIAVVWGDRSWTYAQLNARVNGLTETITRALQRAPSRIGICLDRSVDMVVGVLAAAKTGAAYVPMDPAYATDRLEYMIRDGRLSAILTAAQYAPRLNTGRIPVLFSPETTPLQDGGRDAAPIRGFSANQPLYMIYTSGSTGKPKGSLVSYQGAVNLYRWYHREFGFGPGTRTLLISSLSFDLTQKNIFTPLLNGGSLHLPRSDRFDALALLEAIWRESITSINCTPSTFYGLLVNDVELKKLASLRYVFLGGEPISPKRLSVWTKSSYFNAQIVNSYGPTECSDVVAFHCLTRAELLEDAQIPIGRPIDNTQLVVVDEDLNPTPNGGVGELCIAGAGVGHGYFDRPDLTAEKFVPNPFNIDSGTRLYRSGDQARVRKNGCIDYLGRIDHQVKIRGHRIELGEIEALMARLPQIKECVVTVGTFDGDEKRLIAYYTTDWVPGPEKSVLRRALEGVLLPYQMPSALVALDALPLNANGKVDRRALPQVRQADVISHHQYIAPQTPQQQALAKVWATLLGVQPIGITQNFFEAGGNSIIATRLVALLRQQYGLDIHVNHIFERPTIAGFLEEHPLTDICTVESETIPRTDRAEPAALSFAQHRLWFLQQMSPQSTQYNMCTAVELKGVVDVDRLADSLYRVQVRHAILRTTFINTPEGPRQFIHPPKRIDLRPEGCEPDEVGKKITDFAARVFDLETGPLVAYKLLRAHDRHWYLIVNMHHMVSDGWSVDVFMKAVSEYYRAGQAPSADAGGDDHLQYVDYAQWQRSRLERSDVQKQIDFWKQYLDGIPTCHQIPLDYPRPAVQTENGSAERFAFTPGVSCSIRNMSAKENTSLFIFLLTAFIVVIHKFAGQKDIIIGTPVANRPLPELEELIGLFVNTLVIRNQVDPAGSFRFLLNTVRTHTLQVFEHQTVPYEMIVDHLKPERNLSHSPIFQLLFVLNTKISEHIELRGLQTQLLEPEITTAKYDLNVHFIEKDDHLAGYIEYNTDLFSRETIKRLIGYLTRTIHAILENPEIKIADISIMPEEEYRTIVHRWNETAAQIKEDVLLHQLFEQSCDLFPQRPALYSAAHDQFLTYSALDCMANRMAHYLIEKGVAANEPVAICAHRGIKQITAQLAVLKASGAFVPLDPDLPDKRKKTIIGEAGCRVVIGVQAADLMAWCSGKGCLVMDDAFDLVLDRMPDTRPRQCQTARGLACIFFTSGSTGQPKGILVPHCGLSHDIVHLKHRFRVQPSDRSLLLTNFAFDPSIRDLFIALSAGALCVLMKPEDIKQPAAVLQRIYQHKITHVFSMVPTFLRTMHQYKDRIDPGAGDLKSISLNGEMAYKSDFEMIRDLFGSHVTMVNQYGPTEATMASSSFDATDEARNTASHLMVGRPYPNTRLYLLDDNLEPVARGAIGELYIGGIGVTWGYLNRPDLTAAAFIPDPFAANGGRLYKTGDLGRFRDDGYLELTGRNDFQIKLRGMRIELNEIEHHLMQYPGIKHGVVKLYRPEQGEPELAAYLVTDNGKPLPVAQVRDYLVRRLPNYMVPTIFIFRDTLPTTESGKTDRKALAPPSAQDLMNRQKGAAALSDMERKIALIWSGVLGYTITGRDSNFFEVGGNSLLLLVVFDRLKQEMLPSITVVDMFRHPTIAALAEFIDESEKPIDFRTAEAQNQRKQRILQRKHIIQKRR